MNKRKMSIEEYKNSSGTYTIIINNARYQKNFFNNIKKIIKLFLINEEVFFGFCRTDGVNLTLSQQKKLKKEIPLFFKKFGDMQNISEYLSVARTNLNDQNYGFILSILDYYLETVFFHSKVEWETFKQYHSNYQEHRFDHIILNNFADVLFYYFDSGDFSICFNPKIYNPIDVKSIFEKIMQEEKTGDGSKSLKKSDF